MSECIVGHDYAVVYDLEILPKNAQTLSDDHENAIEQGITLDESGKWFNDELQVGTNRPLIRDFVELAEQNKKEEGSASVCFLISLNKYDESRDKCEETKDPDDTETTCKKIQKQEKVPLILVKHIKP